MRNEKEKIFHHTTPLDEAVVVKFLEKKLDKKDIIVVSPVEIWAEFHKIYIAKVGREELFLRVSKPAIPVIKTVNEIACISWVKKNIKKCPVPDIIAWSSTTEELGYEYVLLSRLPGRDVAIAFKDMTKEDMEGLIEQVADICVEMAQLPFGKVGGLKIDSITGEISPGPVVEETTYDVLHLEKHWKEYPQVTFDSLQIGGPFNSMSDYIAARLRRDLFVLLTHKCCETIKEELTALLQELLQSTTIELVRQQLEARPLCLSHQDLHLGNMLWDKTLTGVLDWEFSGITPLDQWIRRNTFASNIDEAMKQLPTWRDRLLLEIKARDQYVWENIQVVPVKDKLLKLISLTFWIIHCTVTNTQEEDRTNWIQSLRQSMIEYKAMIHELHKENANT